MNCEGIIKKIGDAAVKYYPKYRILPSLTIAQAILESGWGESALARDCYNYFGMKWCEGCGCDSKSYRTAEQNPNGTYYTITAKFRKYSSAAEGVRGYYEFLQYPRYENLQGVTNYKTACKLIKKDGWATSNEYAERLIAIIKQYKLDRYDKKAFEALKTAQKNVETTAAAKADMAKSKATVKKPAWQPQVGDKVIVNGKIYGNGDGSGGKLCCKKMQCL